MKTVEIEHATDLGDDTVLEIDNKSLTNRPDLWCHHGIARELAAIYHCELKAPATSHSYNLEAGGDLVGEIDPSVCDRLSIMEITTSGAAPATPQWMRARMATFKPSVVRRSSLDAGVRTDASTRFEKGLDTGRVDLARDHLLHLLETLDPSATVAGLGDECPRPTQPERVNIGLGFLSDRIGRTMTADEVAATLARLGFDTTTSTDGHTLSAHPPPGAPRPEARGRCPPGELASRGFQDDDRVAENPFSLPVRARK